MKHYIVNIENCGQCPHSDHSGAFTQGGAIPLCRGIGDMGQRVAGVARGGKDWPNRYASVLPFDATVDRRGNPTRRGTGEMPEWCPLPDKPA